MAFASCTVPHPYSKVAKPIRTFDAPHRDTVSKRFVNNAIAIEILWKHMNVSIAYVELILDDSEFGLVVCSTV
jgi:hypothetical protein